MYQDLIHKIDTIAEVLENKGLTKDAFDLDMLSNALEKEADIFVDPKKYNPEKMTQVQREKSPEWTKKDYEFMRLTESPEYERMRKERELTRRQTGLTEKELPDPTLEDPLGQGKQRKQKTKKEKATTEAPARSLYPMAPWTPQTPPTGTPAATVDPLAPWTPQTPPSGAPQAPAPQAKRRGRPPTAAPATATPAAPAPGAAAPASPAAAPAPSGPTMQRMMQMHNYFNTRGLPAIPPNIWKAMPPAYRDSIIKIFMRPEISGALSQAIHKVAPQAYQTREAYLDMLADNLEDNGFIKEAMQIDIMSNTLEKTNFN